MNSVLVHCACRIQYILLAYTTIATTVSSTVHCVLVVYIEYIEYIVLQSLQLLLHDALHYYSVSYTHLTLPTSDLV